MAHRICITIDDHSGLTPHLICDGHEPADCVSQEVFQWDTAGAMEGYCGDRIEFPTIDVEVIAASDDEGFQWEALPAHTNGRSER